MNILTFDIEDWFHLLDNPNTQSEVHWSNFPSRIDRGMKTIYDILDNTGNPNATFFVLGWIAEKYPNLVREISDRGYEVGSHTHLHQLVYEQDQTTFRKDVERSIKTLEDCTGKKVVSFRAPGFSITNENKWAFETLYELGIKYDSSIFPAGRAHGGMPQYSSDQPSILRYGKAELKEFPINTMKVFGKPFIFSGGGYFRVFPYKKIRSWFKKSDYVMTYFHPRDFDPDQPMIPNLSASRRFKSYVGLKDCQSKLEKIIKDFEFISLHEAIEKVDWNNTQIVDLSV